MALSSSHNPALSLLPNLLLILAVATGIVITEPSLYNDRKLEAATEADVEGEGANLESYFWDDPFRNTIHVTSIKPSRFKNEVPFLLRPPSEKGIPSLPKTIVFSGMIVPAIPQAELNPYGNATGGGEVTIKLVDEMAKLSPDARPLLGSLLSKQMPAKVIFVGLEGSQNPADVERRIRTRLAIAHALCARAGLIRCPDTGLSQARVIDSKGDKAHGVAVECFRSANRNVKSETVAVVYVNESKVTPTPKAISHAMIAATTGWHAPLGKPAFAYIGLCRSDHFVAFLDAARADGPAQGGEWNNPAIHIYSPHATVDDGIVNQSWEENRRGPVLSSFLGPDYRFRLASHYGIVHRVGAHDGELVAALVAELENRGVRCAKYATKDNKNRKDATLLLADMDRFHSRRLVGTFADQWGGSSGALRVIHYPEALDALGMPRPTGPSSQAGSSSAQGKSINKGASGSTARGNPGGAHAAEGFIQFDSLSRLPARIRELEQEDNVRYRAIGLFGSDVHDKLQILRALKPKFPRALFFTNDLDARLWQGENRGDSVNLVVAGAFGLSMNAEIQGSAAPFRSSYQTATYLACLHAIGFSPDGLNPKWLENGLSSPDKDGRGDEKNERKLTGVGREVELHEVGRTGDQLLAFHPADPTKQSGLSKSAPGRPDSVIRPQDADRLAKRFFRLVVFIVWLVLVWQLFARFFRDGESLITNLKGNKKAVKAAVSGFVVVTCLCSLAVGYPYSLDSVGGFGEGGGIFSGVSAKPVLAANFLIIAIGIVMAHVLLRKERVSYPYPFRPPVAGETPRVALRAGHGGGQRDKIELPSWMDLAGWFEGARGFLLKKDRPRVMRSPVQWLRAAIAFIGRAEKRRRIRYEKWKNQTWINSDSPKIVFAYARERLVNRNRNVIFRVLIYLGVGFIIYRLIFQGDFSNLEAPPSIRGAGFRWAYEISDMAAKVMLAVVAAIALDRQLTLIGGLDKLYRFLKERSIREAEVDDLEPPYPWHHRPEVVEINQEDAEKSFGVGKGEHFSGHEGFWEMPLLRTAAERFSEVTPCMVLPYMLAFLILVTRHPVFERISSSTSELVLFGFILLAPLAAGILAQHWMGRVFGITQKRLRAAQRFVVKCKPENREKFLSGELASASELESRTKYNFFNNPVVEAILLPLGGYGVLEFSSVFASFLK